MVKVYNWEQNNEPPKNPTAADMRYGIGCMTDLTVQLAISMSALLKKQGASGEVDYSSMKESFEKSTLGTQVKIIEQNYTGVELACSKMEHLVEERNYFTHRFNTAGNSNLVNDAKRLFNLLNLIYKVTEQFENAKKKVDKTVKKKTNKASSDLRSRVKSAAKKCKQYEVGRVNLTLLAQAMPEDIEWSGRFFKFLENHGIPTYIDEKTNKIRYVKIKDL